jgi:type 2 lantibiotic biosynthesis protein LanM
MPPASPFAAPDWYRALTLPERGIPPEGSSSPGEREAAERRLTAWRSQPPFQGNGLFAQRLAADGLDEETLLRLLAESAEQLRARQTARPVWLERLDADFTAPSPGEKPPWPHEPQTPVRDSTAFFPLVEPLARAGYERLRRAIGELPRPAGEPPFDPATAADLFVSRLAGDLSGMVTRVCVLELQVARLDGTLQGETPEERFDNFAASLRRPETALAILQRSPVLARRAIERIEQWIEGSLEFLRRLIADWDDVLRTFFADGHPSALIEVDGGAGDPHHGGRTVMKLRFASGRRLVYKPKPQAVDAAFQDLLRWLGERGWETGFRLLSVLDRGGYGWVEFVTAEPCGSVEEVRRFYRRQGGYLALLYLLAATDFHGENLIAAGEHPVLVDLETLFHPRIDVPDLAAAEQAPGAALGESVLRIGLLPMRVWGDEEHAGVDLSGLGSTSGQTTKPFWGTVEAGTDAMRFERKPMRIADLENRPTLDGETLFLPDFAGEIEAGFRDLYRLVLRHRGELLSRPLAAFAGAPVRVVLRPTAGYGVLLLESFHPHVLGNACEQARLNDRLWGGTARRPWLERVIAAERHDLEQGDVPLFTARPESRDLWTSRGDRLPGFFASSGLERAERTLERWSEEDLERQVWVLRCSLQVVALESRRPERPPIARRGVTAPASTAALVAAAKRAGDRLAALAFREPDQAHWLTMDVTGTGGWLLRPALPDLYLGLPGIALFLGHLGALTGEEPYTRLARAALATQRWQLREEPEVVPSIGGFNGWGGVIYGLAQLAALWQDDSLFAEAEALVTKLAAGIDDDENHDLIAGAGGALLALLAVHRLRPSEEVLSTALRCGEHLLAGARQQDAGSGWVSKITGPLPLAGLSHGAAGIALALLRLSAVCGDERFRAAALAGIAYERSLFSPREGSWRDLREGADEQHGALRSVSAWCHGAAGIGLARIAGLPQLDAAAVRDEIATAFRATLDDPMTPLRDNHSLCHGALGNLEFLRAAAAVLGDAAAREQASRLTGEALRSVQEDGWLYGATPGSEPLGLMVGLAGIGYGLLRLAAPGKVANVLTLEPLAEEPA